MYRVLKPIGEGGMGAVWLAEHVALGRRAALKMLHPEFSSRPDIVTRFFNEARAATAISDPGIVQIFDFGHHTDGSAYIVMELLDGEPLDRRLRREGALGVPDALRLMRQIASSLGAAHARSIVHRDLKPENIFIVRDPEVPGGERGKLLDFGIAKLAGDPGTAKTQTATMMGTPTYMSPEQCRGAGYVDQRSDVYSLGCVLFTLLTGRPPFVAEGAGDIIAMHLREVAPPPSQLRPGVPREVDQLVARCLAKDPAHRFTSAAELAVAIGSLLGSSPQVSASQPGNYAAGTAPTTLSSAAASASAAPSSAPPARRSRTALIATLAGLAIAGGVVAFVTTRDGASAARLGPRGCVRHAPVQPSDFANQCTTAQTVPFDNCARLHLCDPAALAGAMAISAPPTQNVASAPASNEAAPTMPCRDVPNPIYITGSTNLPPLIKAVQPLLSAATPAYTAVFAPQTSCKGAAAVYDPDPAKHVISSATNSANNSPFYYDAAGNKVACLLDDAGVTVDVGESDVFPTSCNPAYTGRSDVADYVGPIQAVTFVVPAASSQMAISAEAAHLVFAAAGNHGAAAPWTDPTLYFTRSAGTGTTQLPSRAIGLDPTKWWGTDRLSATNVVVAMKAIDPRLAEGAIGVLSNDFADRNRKNLRVLAFQQQGQTAAYYPDSTMDSLDKANVRDGHYPMWGPVHLLAATSGGIPSPAAQALVTQFSVPRLDQKLVTAVIDAGFTPACAMKVSRSEEGGPLSAYTPKFGCGCFFEAHVNGATTCHACTGPAECGGSTPACNYGYCEAQ
ncbi:MAG TPA: protein kinase [Kofleriaceae bacterium]|nr:protein kinase [Kofleriaceae bacterium]